MHTSFTEHAARLHERLLRRIVLNTADPDRLDREADAEMVLGHLDAAERLAWLAAALREVRQ